MELLRNCKTARNLHISAKAFHKEVICCPHNRLWGVGRHLAGEHTEAVRQCRELPLPSEHAEESMPCGSVLCAQRHTSAFPLRDVLSRSTWQLLSRAWTPVSCNTRQSRIEIMKIQTPPSADQYCFMHPNQSVLGRPVRQPWRINGVRRALQGAAWCWKTLAAALSAYCWVHTAFCAGDRAA